MNMFKEKQALQNKVKKLTTMIKQKEEHPAKDKNFQDEINDLKIEKASLNEIIHTINQKNVFNFFTDEGLLPNYAFPEAGVTLRSIIYRKKKKGNSHGIYDTKLFEYERPAMSAIHELAPSNRFYAEGRRVMIDQVDMNLSEIEEWRFCNCCPHLEKVSIGEEKSPCPMCGSALWQDEGQKRHMLRMRQVIATTSDRESRSTDDSDDREPEFYNKHMLVDIDKKYREIVYRIDDDSLPFGFEFLRKATFREINFGKKEAIGETVQISGYEVPKNGFAVCTECGKVQTDGVEIKHAMTCKQRGSKSSKSLMDFLYLYREYSSEAIRILLPMTSFAGSTEKLHSFIAAIFLGLKKQFKGKIDHLQATVYEEPIPNTIYRKKYLVLYDLVPGGTGYLKELMLAEKPLIDVFVKALEILKSCQCSNDPAKDGCYHCLYAYRNSYEMADISRETAIRLLTDIVSRKDLLVKTETLDKIPLNALFESELEARFIEALRRLKVNNQPVSLKRDVVNGKPGWFLKVGQAGYYIEPQVELGQKDWVSIPSKVDFVFYPERSGDGTPIAVFTDGFMYHADPAINKPRVGKDMAQRMAIVRSGKYLIWSVSWDDVENKFSTQNAYFENFTNNNIPLLSKFLDAYHDQFHVKKLSAVHNLDSFDMFIFFLSDPNIAMWKMYAFIHMMLHIVPGKQYTKKAVENGIDLLQQDINCNLIVLNLESEDSGNHLCGKYERNYGNGQPMIKLFTCIEKSSLQSNKFSEFRIICRLFDEKDIAINPTFKAVWNGFIRMFNLYQFVKNALFVTSQGIADGEYLGLKPEVTSDVLREEHIAANLNELMGITDPSLHQLLFIIAKNKLPLPEAGFELSNDKGIVIGNAELAWPDQKIAFLMEEEMAYEKAFLSDGWQIFKLQNAIADPEKYISLIKK
jgi:DEAD/DEAH box helicase domain-containing protein